MSTTPPQPSLGKQGSRTYAQIDLNLGERFGQLAKAMGLIGIGMFSLGTLFLSSTIRNEIANWWNEFKTGKRSVKNLNDKTQIPADFQKAKDIGPPVIAQTKLSPTNGQIQPKVAGSIKITNTPPLHAPINPLKVKTSQVNLQSLSSKEYQSFILQNKNKLHPNKRQLLDNTVLQSSVKPSATPLTYQVVSLEEQSFKKVLNSKVQASQTKIECTSKWYDYSDPHSYWMDFANATSFGGGYKGRGNVQEETMFCEFPDLAYLDCAVKGNIHPCKDGHLFCPTDATPFIIKDVTRQWKVNPALYGRNLENKDFQGQISENGTLVVNTTDAQGKVTNTVNKGKAIERLHNQPPVSIIGVAAVDWGKVPAKQRKYQLSHLEYHLKAAYLSNVGAKQDSTGRVSIHTSNWGCGAFDNSNKMMVAIQILAAKMADVDLVFHGTSATGSPTNNYTDQMVAEMQSFIQQNLDQGKTAAEILQLFLKNQEADPEWAPKLPK